MKAVHVVSRQVSVADSSVSQSAAEGVQRQACLGLHCCLDVTCHALYSAAVWDVRYGHNSTIT